jgi:transcriptional regulator with GAF, ATPase, and Fis domain
MRGSGRSVGCGVAVQAEKRPLTGVSGGRAACCRGRRRCGTDRADFGLFPSLLRLTMTKRTRSVDVEAVTLDEISKALRSTPELNKTLNTVVDVLSRHLGVSGAMVTLVTPSGDLELVASSSATDEEISLPGRARDATSKQPMSLVGVPIKACGRDLGVLSCTRRPGEHNGSFQQDVRLLSIVAHLIGEAVKFPESTSLGEHDVSISEAQRLH